MHHAWQGCAECVRMHAVCHHRFAMQLFSCRRLCNALATLLMCWGSISAVVAADPNPVSPRVAITVFAASSLSDVLREIGAAFTTSTGTSLRYSFAASSALARQIEAGAPADAFISADLAWMDYLRERKRIVADSRRNIVSNRLVLIAPKNSTSTLRIAPRFPLAEALGEQGRLSIADPVYVPAGRYAQEALTRLGVWPKVQAKLARAENVRAALAFVARGEAPFGIVYEREGRGTHNGVKPNLRKIAVL